MSTEFKMEEVIEKNEVCESKEPVKKPPITTLVNLAIIGICALACTFWLGFTWGVHSTGGYDPTDNVEIVETTEATETTEPTEETAPETTEATIPETTEETIPETEPVVKPTEPKPTAPAPKPTTPTVTPTEPSVDSETTAPDPSNKKAYLASLIKTPQTDREMLAAVIFQEVGWDRACDECRRRVADVVLNRVADDRFPDTIHGVLSQKSQYGRMYWTGVVWPSWANNVYEIYAIERAYRIADEVLAGQHSELYGNGYVWQASFKQGKEQIYCCGHYFGR